jgi:hypothetical protein
LFGPYTLGFLGGNVTQILPKELKTA